MQIAVDLNVETPEALDLLANLITHFAALKRSGVLPAYVGGTPFGSNADVPAGTPPEVPTPPPVVPTPPPSNVVAFPQLDPNRDPRDAAFRGHTDASPLVPPAPNVAGASAIPPAPPAAVIPPAPTTPTNAAITPAASAATSADEYDSAGMPWDGRIHQKGKGKKKDNTWKLQKGIDEAIVSAVTKELFTSGRVRSPGAAVSTPAPVGASAPVSVQGGPQIPPPPAAVQIPTPPSAVQIPPPPPVEGGQGQAQIPPPPGIAQVVAQAAGIVTEAAGIVAQAAAEAGLVPPPPVSVPSAPVLGVPNADNAGVVPAGGVDPFRAFVAKVTAARTAGKISAEQVTALIQSVGAPSLQLLKNMPHLLPAAELELDTLLATA